MLIAPVALAAPAKDRVVVNTLPSGAANSFFELNPVYSPMFGQTFTVAKPVRAKRIVIHPYEANLVLSEELHRRLQSGEYDQSWVTTKTSDFALASTTTVELWRYDAGTAIPDDFDTAVGFTSVYKGVTTQPVNVGKPFTVALAPQVVLAPGTYFASFGFDFANKQVMVIRFAGQQNGTYKLGGYKHDVAGVPCQYTPTKDSYPGGQSYRLSLAQTQPASGPFPGTVGFGTPFSVATTKVTECVVLGLYGEDNMVWNPGDLQMEIIGR
jgi:hypothetical protein